MNEERETERDRKTDRQRQTNKKLQKKDTVRIRKCTRHAKILRQKKQETVNCYIENTALLALPIWHLFSVSEKCAPSLLHQRRN